MLGSGRESSRSDEITEQRNLQRTSATVNTGSELILFDTGNGALSRDYPQLRSRLSEGRLVEGLAQAGYKPSDIDIVVITHGHPDHIGGLMDGGKPVFPNARYVFGATEFDFWKRGENVREARKFNLQLFTKLALPLADRSRFIKPGDEVAPGITRGRRGRAFARHACLSRRERGQASADLGRHLRPLCHGDPAAEWHLDVDDDKDKAVATRQRILAMAAAERLFVTGYHMPFPGIGMIDKTADGYRWVPVSYQLDL